MLSLVNGDIMIIVLIWDFTLTLMKIAHEFYKNNYTKLLIDNVEFQKAQRCVNNQLEMSFSNRGTKPLQQSGQIQHTNINYSIEYPDSDNEDGAIKSLCSQIKLLAIE